jgi:hypothetical protein
MKLPIAEEIIHWDLLFQVIWTAALAGVVVTIAVSLAIFGAARAGDARRDRDRADQVVFSALFVLGVAACAAAVVLGIVVMTTKG